MTFFPKIFASKDEPADALPAAPESDDGPLGDAKSQPVTNVDSEKREDAVSSDGEEMQKGVGVIEATVKVWTPAHIYLAYSL